ADRYKGTTASEAVGGFAELVNRDAQEALARAEREQINKETTKDIQEMLMAQTEKESRQSANFDAQGIEQELDLEENLGVLEAKLPPHLAEQAREIVETQGVADSWESADADETMAVEDETHSSIRVFNFPM